MKTSVLISSLLLSALMFTSCSEDLRFEPSPSSNPKTFTPEYHLSIDVRSSLDLAHHSDEREGINTLRLTGKGYGTSETLGEVYTELNLYYGPEDGALYGTVIIELVNSEEQLTLRVNHRLDSREWSDVSGNCLGALSSQQFADMDFNGEMCLTDIPSELLEVGSREISFTINGILK